MNIFCKHLGHKYRPRYNSSLDGSINNAGGISASMVEALKTKVYVHDVCERCGNVVNNKGD